MTYEESVAYLSTLIGRGWRLGLDRMERFCVEAGVDTALGGPSGPRFIHVAGTNGKGSVTAFLQSMLVESGHRTGAYFSPYVYDLRERVQFGRRMIAPEEFAEVATEVRRAADRMEGTELGGVTEFEFKTAVGFRFWQKTNCDWVALEVGLGGRLDATNVVDPAAAAIVSIGLDHAHILGDTREKIAFEKAGIIKPGRPTVVGDVGPGPLEVIRGVARQKGSPVWEYGREIRVAPDADGWAVETPAGTVAGLHPGLIGPIQVHNMALAVAAMLASGATDDHEALRRGAQKAWIPGRFERREFLVDGSRRLAVLDGAHNAESAAVLADAVRRLYPGYRVVLLTGMLTGHEPGPFVAPFDGLLKSVHVGPIDFHRAVDPDKLAAILRDEVPSDVPVAGHSDRESALAHAQSETGDRDLLLVAGSFYLVGSVGPLLPTPGA
ncbi:MAG: folylpolyglutamate synthase/dihydrofolate synthase family protein [Fimbriimonadaceae bacterium]